MFEKVIEDIRVLNNGTLNVRGVVRGLLSQGFQAIIVYRFFHWCRNKRIPTQPIRFLCERFIEITTGISIPAGCRIGGGLRIYHFGGIILHPTVEIGTHCKLYHDVTIGDKGGAGGAAKIGNNVMIGAGAKIIGEITIGDCCRIGANSVITKNQPSHTTAIGNPAKFYTREDRNGM